MTEVHKKNLSNAIREKHSKVRCVCCRKDLKKVDGMKIVHSTISPARVKTMWLCAACKLVAEHDQPIVESYRNLIRKRRETACD